MEISKRSFMQGVTAASASLPFGTSNLFAQADYPSKVIHSIGGFIAGGAADVFVRYYGKQLTDRAGGTLITENKVGANGNIATEFVAKSKPDGYTIFIAPGASFLAAAPSLFKKLSYDPINDFDHITTLLRLTFILVVSADSPFHTVDDLVAHLRKQGDKASYGSGTNTGLISSELFKANFGLKTVEVKYKTNATMLSDLRAGHLVFAHWDPIQAVGLIANGQLRALATASRERFKALPNIPSAGEVGISNSDIVTWWSVHTPKGTPRPILDKLEGWFNDIVASEDNAKFLARYGADPFPGNSALVKEMLIKDTERWRNYVKLANIEPQG